MQLYFVVTVFSARRWHRHTGGGWDSKFQSVHVLFGRITAGKTRPDDFERLIFLHRKDIAPALNMVGRFYPLPGIGRRRSSTYTTVRGPMLVSDWPRPWPHAMVKHGPVWPCPVEITKYTLANTAASFSTRLQTNSKTSISTPRNITNLFKNQVLSLQTLQSDSLLRLKSGCEDAAPAPPNHPDAWSSQAKTAPRHQTPGLPREIPENNLTKKSPSTFYTSNQSSLHLRHPQHPAYTPPG